MCPLAKSSAASLVQGCARSYLGSLYFVSPSNADRSCQSTTQPVRDSLESEDVLVDLNFSWRVPRLDIAGRKIDHFFGQTSIQNQLDISLAAIYCHVAISWYCLMMWIFSLSMAQMCTAGAVLTRPRLCFVFFVKIGLTVPVGRLSRQEERSLTFSPR